MESYNPKPIFFLLCTAFLVYTFSIYLIPWFDDDKSSADQNRVADGMLVYQKYNCQACHQLFGLGGYLGPDLTNVYSTKGKGPNLIQSVVRYGNKVMPQYKLEPFEMNALLEFLRATDESGSADFSKFRIKSDGMIISEYKQ